MFKVSLSAGRERDDSRALYGGRLRVKGSRTATGVVRVVAGKVSGALCIDFTLVGYVTTVRCRVKNCYKYNFP